MTIPTTNATAPMAIQSQGIPNPKTRIPSNPPIAIEVKTPLCTLMGAKDSINPTTANTAIAIAAKVHGPHVKLFMTLSFPETDQQ
jgi:hypothetical protein